MDPISIALALGSAFLGKPKKKTSPVANQMANQYMQISPEMIQMLRQRATATGMTPSMQVGMRGAEADANKYYGQASTNALRSLSGRGLSNSSIRDNAMVALAGRQAGGLAQTRAGYVGQMDDRQMDAIRALFGGISGNAGQAMGIQQGYDASNAAATSNWAQSFGQLLAGMGQQGTPGAGGTGATPIDTSGWPDPSRGIDPRIQGRYPGETRWNGGVEEMWDGAQWRPKRNEGGIALSDYSNY